MARVFSAKAMGAWLLHLATLREPLDYFVLFSSVAANLDRLGKPIMRPPMRSWMPWPTSAYNRTRRAVDQLGSVVRHRRSCRSRRGPTRQAWRASACSRRPKASRIWSTRSQPTPAAHSGPPRMGTVAGTLENVAAVCDCWVTERLHLRRPSGKASSAHGSPGPSQKRYQFCCHIFRHCWADAGNYRAGQVCRRSGTGGSRT